VINRRGAARLAPEVLQSRFDSQAGTAIEAVLIRLGKAAAGAADRRVSAAPAEIAHLTDKLVKIAVG
jgi:hypothetical protein